MYVVVVVVQYLHIIGSTYIPIYNKCMVYAIDIDGCNCVNNVMICPGVKAGCGSSFFQVPYVNYLSSLPLILSGFNYLGMYLARNLGHILLHN